MTRHTFTRIFILLCAPVLAAVNPVLAAAPTAPTGVSATAGNAQATVKFTAPTVSTGYTMSGYTASCTATGKTTATATATSAPSFSKHHDRVDTKLHRAYPEFLKVSVWWTGNDE